MPEAKEKERPQGAALARKKRIERRQQQRASDDATSPLSGNKRPREEEEEKPKPSIVGIKRQARYEPGVPMTKEELIVWRKEARRVRNRESAAASRRKTRDRITELEGLMSTLQKKYEAAMERILELEAMNATLSAEQSSSVVSPCTSASPSPQYAPSFVLDESSRLEDNENVEHIIEMISRPNA